MLCDYGGSYLEDGLDNAALEGFYTRLFIWLLTAFFFEFFSSRFRVFFEIDGLYHLLPNFKLLIVPYHKIG